MPFSSILLISFSLAMDAFSVSVSSCMRVKNAPGAIALKFGLFFGGFQFIMPVLGAFTAGSLLSNFTKISNVISLILLALIGGKMVYESFGKPESCGIDEIKNAETKKLFVLAIATSIDAFAVGVTFALEQVNVLMASAVIGVVTFVCSYAGARFGSALSFIPPKLAERIGGFVLIGIGIKIFLGL